MCDNHSILYRVYGGSAKQLGAYWTSLKPSGLVQSINDIASNPGWGSNATKAAKVEVPASIQVLLPKDIKIMSNIKNNNVFQKALAHVIQHAEFNENTVSFIDYITNNKGNVPFCIRMLRSYAEANAMVSWVRDSDLIAFKQWCFIAAKLNRMVIQFDPIGWFPAYEHLYALLSDNEEIISWYSQHRVSYDRQGSIKDRDNPRKPDFHGYQLILALNHEWELLRERCELILSTELKKDRKYLIDHRFYLALANGDKTEMENVLTELTSPKISKIRNHEFSFTFTEHFISTFGVIYAKLAWRNGYQLEIDSPWIPKEWLAIQPLDEYPEPWDFLKDFDLWTKFDGEFASWSPKRQMDKTGKRFE